jgi:hypothetical protein
MFGELRFEVEDEIAEGDKVVQLVTMSGNHISACWVSWDSCLRARLRRRRGGPARSRVVITV